MAVGGGLTNEKLVHLNGLFRSSQEP